MLTKTPIDISFAGGLDQKTDPFRVAAGKFLRLENSVFTKEGLLQKRAGFDLITSLPTKDYNYLTTFNGNLTAIGPDFAAFDASVNSWGIKGDFQGIDLNTLPLIRNNFNQSQTDVAIAANGLVCTVYTEVQSGSTTVRRYAIADRTTGQNLVAPTTLIATSGTVTSAPRVFLLGSYFIILFSTSTNHLQYIAVSTANPNISTAAADISTSIANSSTQAFDAAVANNTLILAWNGNAASGLKTTTLTSTLVLSATVIQDAAHQSTVVSVNIDTSPSSSDAFLVWALYYDAGTSAGYALAINGFQAQVVAPMQVITAENVANITASAMHGTNTFIYEVNNNYAAPLSAPTHYLRSNTVDQTPTVGTPTTFIRSVGLASKSVWLNGVIYFLSAFASTYQSTYYLMDLTGTISARWAYGNGGGYSPYGLANLLEDGETLLAPYLQTDLIEAVNKDTNVSAHTQTAGIYSQTGINLISLEFTNSKLTSAEIGQNLFLSGGFLWEYDGYVPVENNFFLWPDAVGFVSTATVGGALAHQIHYYQALYEWSDNQGNVYRSAPSIPLLANISGSGTNTNTITLQVPTLRLTYKTANPVKITLYRWSTAQQTYYQVTSITSPLQNSLTTDSVTFTDILSDASILGNNILYTTGGVVENISPPALSAITLFGSRLFGINAEDRNQLVYSKTVIENTSVDMSDLFTYFVAPTLAAQGPTGEMRCVSPMDDKLIIFKKDAAYYLTGNGPDNTGANNDYPVAPVFITSVVGCSNQASIVFTPNGLLFQSDKGIWQLGRDLSTQYIGKDVEDFTQNALVVSAVGVPGTNQVRFTLDSGITLVYDYFFGQWGTFTGIPALSSTLYGGMHTFIDKYGRVAQETAGNYMDMGSPVLMAFTTAWIKLAGLQGFERFYFANMLGTYLSPFSLQVGIAYDYIDGDRQQITVLPSDFGGTWGSDNYYGASSPYGGINNGIFSARLFPEKQKCQSFQLSVDEQYDASQGRPAGAGLTLSGLALVVGAKRGFRTQSAKKSFG